MTGTTVLPRGRQTLLRLKDQTDFKTGAAGAGAFELNTYTRNFQKKADPADDDVLGQVGYANNTDSRPAAPAVEDASGTLSVPFDMAQIGYWLKGLFGTGVDEEQADPAPAGTYAHTWTSGGDSLPIRTLETVFGATQFEALIGAVVQDATFPIGADKGYAQVDLTLSGRQRTDPYTASVFEAPTVVALGRRAPKSIGTISIGGVSLGRVQSGSLKVTNTIDLDRYAGDRQQSDAFLSAMAAEVDATVRYTSDAVRQYGIAGTDGVLPDPVAVELDWILSPYMKLSVTLPAVRFSPMDVPVQNGGLMTVALKGRAEISAGAAMLTAVLTNLTAAY
jgi:hypothetical protein